MKKKTMGEYLKLVTFIIISIIVIILVINFNKEKTTSTNVKQIKLGDIIVLDDNDKQLLRNKTIENIKNNLKAPNTAEFKENFEYICNEENIVEVKGYVDSQNSFGATIRGYFTCQYFAIDADITTLVLLKYDDQEIVNIKDVYIMEYKKQQKLESIQQTGNQLSQEKLEYIKEEFNGNAWNNVGIVQKVIFNEEESKIEIKVIAESSRESAKDKEYWTNYNVCSVLHYFNEFDIPGKVKMIIYDIDDNEILELTFDDEFLKKKWKNNSQINLVKELFGEYYNEL